MEVTREEMLELAKRETFHLDDRLCPFDRETRQRIMKFAANYATSAFYRKFGKQLMHINNAERYESRARRDWLIGRAVTLTGWLLAVLMFVIVMLK